MIKLRPHVATIAAWMLPLVACADAVGTVDDLRVAFRVQPTVVQNGDSMVARLAIVNPTADTITLSSGSGCVITLDVLKDGQRVDMEGSTWACTTAVTYFRIAPRDSLVSAHDLVALLREDQSPWRYVKPPASGVYQVRAAMQVNLPDEYAEFQVIP